MGQRCDRCRDCRGATGRVTGVGSGAATIFLDVQGSRGTKTIRVLPNYQGTWSGSYIVRSCAQTGQLAGANLCGDTFSVNRVLPTSMNLTQDRDRVQGRFFLGTLGADGSGPVQGDGRLAMTGAVQDGGLTIEVTWAMDSTSAGRVTGGLSQLLRASGLSGDVRVGADIRDLNAANDGSRAKPRRVSDGRPHQRRPSGDGRGNQEPARYECRRLTAGTRSMHGMR